MTSLCALLLDIQYRSSLMSSPSAIIVGTTIGLPTMTSATTHCIAGFLMLAFLCPLLLENAKCYVGFLCSSVNHAHPGNFLQVGALMVSRARESHLRRHGARGWCGPRVVTQHGTCANSGCTSVAKRGHFWLGVDRRGHRSCKGVNMWHFGLGLNRINRILISTNCNLFFKISSSKNSDVKRINFGMDAEWDPRLGGWFVINVDATRFLKKNWMGLG